MNALHIAILFNDVQLARGMIDDQSLIRLLLENGADPEYESEGRITPLHHVARYATDPDLVQMLVNAGGDVNALAIDDMTPLHFAALYNGSPAVIAALVNAGADIESKDTRYGGTPLQFAVAFAIPETITGFINAGANMEVVTPSGETLLDLANKNVRLSGSNVLTLLGTHPL